MTYCLSCGKGLNKTDIFCSTSGTKSESQNEVIKTVDKKEPLPLSFSDFKPSKKEPNTFVVPQRENQKGNLFRTKILMKELK